MTVKPQGQGLVRYGNHGNRQLTMTEVPPTSSRSPLANFARGFVVCIVSLLVCWLLLASLLALGFGGSPFDNNPFDDRVFNQSQWLSDATCSDGSNRRGHMAQDIIRRDLKKGMSGEEIVRLLGEPQRYSVSEFTRYYRHGDHFFYTTLVASKDPQPEVVLGYYLGEELDLAWGIDHADLYVYLRDGRYRKQHWLAPVTSLFY